MRRINGDDIIFTNFKPCGKAVAAFAVQTRLCILGSVAIGNRDAEQASADNSDATDQEGTAFDAFALNR